MTTDKRKIGIITGLGAYIIWGFLPIYWKLIGEVSAGVVMAHRVLWSFVFLILIIVFTKQTTAFIKQFKYVLKHKKMLLTITVASIFISFNWLVFIWAVQNGYVIQTSLGYYINPLISVLLSIVFLKEKLSKAQIAAFSLATFGVIYLTFSYGVFPWISLILAFSFGIYGLLKKVVNINSIYSLTIETLLITPIAIIYLMSNLGPTIGLNVQSFETNALLLLSGIATAVPLLLFGSAVRYLPLSTVGFLQYLAPTIMLMLGIFLYNETFTQAHLFSFIIIWIALIIYMTSTFRPKKRIQVKNVNG